MFLWFLLPFLVLMVLSGGRHEREEEYSGHSDLLYEDEEGEGDESEDDNASNKTSLTPSWKYVTKLEGRKGVEPQNFYASMIVIKENLILVHIPM